jgi:hypothetical protein
MTKPLVLFAALESIHSKRTSRCGAQSLAAFACD